MLKSRSCIAVPPGATITEQLANKGITRRAFALKMGLSERRVIALLHGEDRLTPDIAVRLESVLGVPAQFWSNLERIYLNKRALIERGNAKTESP